MNSAKQVFGFLFIGIGVLRLIINLFSSITVPGSESVNLSLIHDSLSGAIWGFGFLIVGMQLLLLSVIDNRKPVLEPPKTELPHEQNEQSPK
jgi:Na+/phosphate symporter